jgi:hypothetical protein
MNKKKIIAFSLWGDNPLYTQGAIWNAEHRSDFYPEWNCRFYYDDSVQESVLSAIHSTESEMVRMGKTVDTLGMYWRFHPMFDDDKIERFIVRDTDSKFCIREVKMVNEWVVTGKPFHIIRDNAAHGVMILGGTWGAIPGCIPDFEHRMCKWFTVIPPDQHNPRGLFHGTDQMFLAKHIWPEIKGNHVAHIRANMPQLRYTGDDIEVADPEDGHYIGMIC